VNRFFILSLSLIQLISWGSVFYAFALFVAPIEVDLDIIRAQSSMGFSLALLMEGIFAYGVGILIDRGYERFVMTTGSLLLAFGMLALGTVHSLNSYLLAWSILGIGLSGTLYTPAFAVVTRRFPLQFRSAIITITFLGGLASTVFIPLIYLMISKIGWRETAYFLGILNLLFCMPLHYTILKDAPPRDIQATKIKTTHMKDIGFLELIKTPTFLFLCVFNVFFMAVTAAVPAHLINLLRESALASWLVIAVPTGVGLLQVVGRLGLYYLERRVESHVINRWSPCLIPISILSLLIGYGNPIWTIIFVLTFGLGNGMLTIVRGTSVAQYLNTKQIGSLNGIIGFPVSIARAAAPLILGELWTVDYGYQTGLWFLLIISVLGSISFILAQKYSLIKT
jgi:MFS family permease